MTDIKYVSHEANQLVPFMNDKKERLLRTTKRSFPHH